MVKKMKGFSGKYYYNLDDRGRVMIPVQFREIISAHYSHELYITNAAFDKCLQVYPHEEWMSLLEKVRSLPKMYEEVRFFMRRVIAPAINCELDKQGRILIPSAFREDAGLNGEVVIVGQIDRIEIWDKKEWDNATDPSKIDRQRFIERLGELGL